MLHEILTLTGEHLLISLAGIFLGAITAIPLGIWVARHPRLGSPLIDFASMLYTIPSLALLGFLIPFLGLGKTPAVTALFLYSLLPLLRNTFIGITEVDQTVIDSATGMGATRSQILWHIELPLALPFIMAGLRTVTVLTVGIATLGSLVGAGGLGVLVFRGIHMMDNQVLLAGTLPITAIALTLDHVLGCIEARLNPTH